MIRRVVAALAAVILAAVGVVLVVSYANRADERALEGMETTEVLVALEHISAGTEAVALEDRVELRPVPQAFVVDGAVTDLQDLEGQVTTAELAEGEQLHRARFATPEELRARGDVELPDEAADLHQVTVALDRARALGGNVTAGDTVGVFMSFDISGTEGYVLLPDGTIVREEADEDAEGTAAPEGGAQVTTTHLTLHKVLVARVEGGYVAAQGDTEDEGQGAQDSVDVTLALEAPEAEQLVYAMEFGSVWLSFEPETADEDGTGVVVVTIPNEARNVYQ